MTNVITSLEQPIKPENFFYFGENWSDFLNKNFNDNTLAEAVKSLKDFCGEENIKDKTFLDIGCGSGLFSLAAFKLGAKSITSIDIDENSVACCKKLKEIFGNSEIWQIIHGSILDDKLLNILEKYDFVYSWGVLHHTGDMWRAIENAASTVKSKGNFCLAIYNKSDGFNIYPDYRFGNSYLWRIEKNIYCKSPRILQKFIDYFVMLSLIIIYSMTLRNPFTIIRNHKNLRGMNWKTDITDWLGGYPYEYATVEEIFRFLKARGFRLENLKSNNGLLNNEFLFVKE